MKNTIRIVMGDPGRQTDPFGIVGIELNLESEIIRPRLARQFIKTRYGIVADYLRDIKENAKPDFMGLETNNRGGKVLQLFQEKYNLKLLGINTCGELTEESRERGKSMDKPFMVSWLKQQLIIDNVEFPINPSTHMAELQNQLNQIVGIRGPGGNIQYKATRGRHDDLFMAFLLCCHMARLYLRRQEMLA